jgi:hypothetical protein
MARRTALARRRTTFRRSGPSPALKKAQAALANARTSLARARKNNRKPKLAPQLTVIAGGGAAGAVETYAGEMGDLAVWGLGIACIAAGTMEIGVKGKTAGYVACLGAGMLAAQVKDVVVGALDGGE